MLRKLVPVLLALLVLPLAGCGSPQIGVKNTFGTLKTMVDSSPEEVTAAAEKVAREMNLEIIEVASTAIDGKLEAMTATGKKVTITARTAGDNVTKLAVRAGGGFGDEGLSLNILNKVKDAL